MALSKPVFAVEMETDEIGEQPQHAGDAGTADVRRLWVDSAQGAKKTPSARMMGIERKPVVGGRAMAAELWDLFDVVDTDGCAVGPSSLQIVVVMSSLPPARNAFCRGWRRQSNGLQ